MIPIIFLFISYSYCWYDISYPFRFPIDISNTIGENLSETLVPIKNPIFNESDLILSYHFEEFGDVAIDSSGNGNDGKIYNAYHTNGYEDYGLNFTGINSFICLDKPFSCNETSSNEFFDKSIYQRTIILWFYAYDINKMQVLYEEGGANSGINIYIFGGKIFSGAWNGTNGLWLSYNISEGKWHMVSLVFDYYSGVFKLYLNGRLVNYTYLTFFIGRHEENDAIGGVIENTRFHNGTFIGNGYYFVGIIDEVRIYDRALSDEEIDKIYNFKGKLNYFDVRFTWINSSREVPIKYERISDGLFYVLIPYIARDSSARINLYFGNPNAKDNSSKLTDIYNRNGSFYENIWYDVFVRIYIANFSNKKYIINGSISIYYYDYIWFLIIDVTSTWSIFVYCDGNLLASYGPYTTIARDSGLVSILNISGINCKEIYMDVVGDIYGLIIYGDYNLNIYNYSFYNLSYYINPLEKNIIIKYKRIPNLINNRSITFEMESNAKIINASLEINGKNYTMRLSRDKLKAYYTLEYNCNENYAGLYIYRYHANLVCNTYNASPYYNFTLEPTVEVLWKKSLGKVSIIYPTFNKTVMKFNLRACGSNITVRGFTFKYISLYKFRDVYLKIFLDLLNRETIQDPDSYYIQVTDSYNFTDTILYIPVKVEMLNYTRIGIGMNKTFAVVIDIK